jgi:hypothetical protein
LIRAANPRFIDPGHVGVEIDRQLASHPVLVRYEMIRLAHEDL